MIVVVVKTKGRKTKKKPSDMFIDKRQNIFRLEGCSEFINNNNFNYGQRETERSQELFQLKLQEYQVL